MRKVIVSNIMSLDGRYAGSDDNPLVLPMDEAFDAYNLERIRTADVVLLGRRSYEGFAAYWPYVADHPSEPGNRAYSDTNREISRIYNRIDKVVVTDRYRPEPDHPWHDTTTVLSGVEVRDWLAGRKHDDGGDILLFGSRTLWNSLLADGLIDELHLMVGATVVGEGVPLFTTPVSHLTLLDVRRFGTSDNVVLQYGAGRSAGFRT